MQNEKNSQADARPFLTQRVLLEGISSKWSVQILSALCAQPRRFNELLREMDGVTQKALTQCLRRLERIGIISRTVLVSSPVAVEYAITPLGRSLGVPLRALLDWTAEHKETVREAYHDFDRRGDAERDE